MWIRYNSRCDIRRKKIQEMAVRRARSSFTIGKRQSDSLTAQEQQK